MPETLVWRVDRLHTLREQHGWSQRDMGRRCGIGETMIAKYEGGLSIPSIANLKQMAQALDVSADYLIGITDDPRGHLGDGELSDEERRILDAFRRESWKGLLSVVAEQMTK